MAKTNKDFIYEGMSPEDVAAFEADAAGPAGEGAPITEQTATVEAAPQEGQPSIEAQPQQQPSPQMVDVRAVQEARAAARTAEQELAKYRAESAAEQARLNERLAIINQAIEAQNKPVVKAPTKDEDPLGYYDHQLDSVNGKFQSIEDKLKAFETAEQQKIQAQQIEAQRSAVIDEAQAVINVATQAKPELQEAINFALNGVRAEIASMLDAQQVPYAQRQQVAEQWWRNSMVNLAQRCPRDPQQAAEFVMSNARYYGYGYQQPTPNGGQPVPAQQAQQVAPQVQQKTVQERADQQNRHMSLSGTQGGQPMAQLDAKTLANMTDEQFFALKKTVEGRSKISSIQAGD